MWVYEWLTLELDLPDCWQTLFYANKTIVSLPSGPIKYWCNKQSDWAKNGCYT